MPAFRNGQNPFYSRLKAFLEVVCVVSTTWKSGRCGTPRTAEEPAPEQTSDKIDQLINLLTTQKQPATVAAYGPMGQATPKLWLTNKMPSDRKLTKWRGPNCSSSNVPRQRLPQSTNTRWPSNMPLLRQDRSHLDGLSPTIGSKCPATIAVTAYNQLASGHRKQRYTLVFAYWYINPFHIKGAVPKRIPRQLEPLSYSEPNHLNGVLSCMFCSDRTVLTCRG